MVHPRVEYLISRPYAEQRSKEWLELRGKLLTASDVATAIGLNPYETPEHLIAKKCGATRPWSGNEATSHGTRLEPMVRDLYDSRYGQKSHEIGVVQHPVHTFLGGSPDGITESGRLLEIKCPLTRKIKPEVPVYYMPQIQILLEIVDLEVCDFVQYKESPEEFSITEVPRDRAWFTTYLPVMQAFWNRVLECRRTGFCQVDIAHEEPLCEVSLE